MKTLPYMEKEMCDSDLALQEILELAPEHLQDYIQTNLIGLSEINMESSVLMTSYDMIADGIKTGEYGQNPTTLTMYRKGPNFETLVNVIDRMCNEGKLDWHAVNAAHAANVVALERKAKLVLTTRKD